MASRFFIQKDGQTLGPMSSSDLMKLAQSGKLAPEDLVWKEGTEKKVRANQVKGLTFKSPQVVPPSSVHDHVPSPVKDSVSPVRSEPSNSNDQREFYYEINREGHPVPETILPASPTQPDVIPPSPIQSRQPTILTESDVRAREVSHEPTQRHRDRHRRTQPRTGRRTSTFMIIGVAAAVAMLCFAVLVFFLVASRIGTSLNSTRRAVLVRIDDTYGSNPRKIRQWYPARTAKGAQIFPMIMYDVPRRRSAAWRDLPNQQGSACPSQIRGERWIRMGSTRSGVSGH